MDRHLVAFDPVAVAATPVAVPVDVDVGAMASFTPPSAVPPPVSLISHRCVGMLVKLGSRPYPPC